MFPLRIAFLPKQLGSGSILTIIFTNDDINIIKLLIKDSGQIILFQTQSSETKIERV